MKKKFNVIIEQDEDGWFVSEVVELPGCHTQAKTMEQLVERTKDAISLYLEAKKGKKEESKFIALHQIEV